MTNKLSSYRIFPLGDSAITIDFGNIISTAINDEVIARYNEFTLAPLPGMIEAVPAYSSLTIYYSVATVRKKLKVGETAYQYVEAEAKKRLQQPALDISAESRLVQIPVCYENEFAPDLENLASVKNLSAKEVIAIYTADIYKVYMLGFLPGFPYMGEVDEKIAMPRKPQPVNVAAGSVGIAGKQTGIYPFNSPGGWQIIGRTPFKMFSINSKNPSLLKTGDRVQFYSITKEEYWQLAKQP